MTQSNGDVRFTRGRWDSAAKCLLCAMWPGESDEKIQDRWEKRRHILSHLARLYADDCWHQLLWGILNRLQEEPLEVGRSALPLV
jgi:hypothetical protein